MRQWCLGFVFDAKLKHVLLLRKGRTLHVGLWNGIGGVIEPGESPHLAMERECSEEAVIEIADWQKVGTIVGAVDIRHTAEPWKVHTYAVVSDLIERFEIYSGASVPVILPDTPVRVPVARVHYLELAPHTHIFINNALLQIRDPDRLRIQISEGPHVPW